MPRHSKPLPSVITLLTPSHQTKNRTFESAIQKRFSLDEQEVEKKINIRRAESTRAKNLNLNSACTNKIIIAQCFIENRANRSEGNKYALPLLEKHPCVHLTTSSDKTRWGEGGTAFRSRKFTNLRGILSGVAHYSSACQKFIFFKFSGRFAVGSYLPLRRSG